MSSILVVVADIVGKESLEVALVAGDDMVEQIAAATAHPSLGDSILPWSAEGGANRFCAHGFHGGQDFKPELGVTIKDEIFGGRIIREGFPQLMDNPGTGRMPSDVAV